MAAAKERIEIAGVAAGLILFLILFPMNLRKAAQRRSRPAPPAEEAQPPPVPAAGVQFPIGSASASQQRLERPPPPKDEAAAARQEEILNGPWVRDPFLSPKVKASAPRVKLQLQGISITGSGKALAVVNEQIVREGDRLEDYSVERIEPEQVILKRQGRELILKLEEEQ